MKNLQCEADRYLNNLTLVDDLDVRAVAAQIIWWDEFSQHKDPANQRWGFASQLRRSIASLEDITPGEVSKALQVAGWGINKSETRATAWNKNLQQMPKERT